MPELSEVKIMSDFINQIVDGELFFDKIEKSPESKVKTELNPFDSVLVKPLFAKAHQSKYPAQLKSS